MQSPKGGEPRTRWTIARLMRWVGILAVDLALVAPLARGRGGAFNAGMALGGAMLVGYLNVLVFTYLGALRQVRAYRARGRPVGAAAGGCLALVSILVALLAAMYVGLLISMRNWAD
jgi:hypothetical protein